MSGGLSSVEDHRRDELEEDIYELIQGVCEDFGIDCYCPHQSETNPGAPVPHAKVWRTDYNRIEEKHLIFAYVGEPSLGVGSEIVMAGEVGSDVVLVCERENFPHVPASVRQHPAVKEIIQFTDPEDLEQTVADLLEWYLSETGGWQT